jgi:putative oxidoreductase
MMTVIKRLLKPHYTQPWLSLALLMLRLIMGLAFVMHGQGKMMTPFTWMGDAPVPSFLQLLAAVSEYYGGMALMLGLFTRPAALGLFCTMTVAAVMGHIMQGDPFVNPKGGSSYELAAVYWAISTLLLITGAGAFSLDAWLFNRNNQTGLR